MTAPHIHPERFAAGQTMTGRYPIRGERGGAAMIAVLLIAAAGAATWIVELFGWAP